MFLLFASSPRRCERPEQTSRPYTRSYTGAYTPLTSNGGADRATVFVPIHQGETIPVVLGVTNRGTVALAGVAAFLLTRRRNRFTA